MIHLFNTVYISRRDLDNDLNLLCRSKLKDLKVDFVYVPHDIDPNDIRKKEWLIELESSQRRRVSIQRMEEEDSSPLPINDSFLPDKRKLIEKAAKEWERAEAWLDKKNTEREIFMEGSSWGASEETTSIKNDRKDHKLRWELLPLELVENLVAVYTFGAEKYAENSWQNLPDGYRRYKAALFRHIVAYEKGETIDPESGLPHLAHAAWNALALIYFSGSTNRK